jgi:hypothetical protein
MHVCLLQPLSVDGRTSLWVAEVRNYIKTAAPIMQERPVAMGCFNHLSCPFADHYTGRHRVAGGDVRHKLALRTISLAVTLKAISADAVQAPDIILRRQ